eukprot:TRINITY_DN7962_c0_g1_i1.p1 TRINITY_DN7962_c0_g1~~TRINITY_DN7962_c0_g1_i1.p1  ORF type:complete len:224 (-),score=31.15 TRINITY_DN7962_c0_g1_i1:118-756(-)
MKRTILLLLVLFVSGVVMQNNNWDYLLFVQQWPGTFCTGSCPVSVSFWTIHGLWPNRNDGSWPQYCPGPTFTVSNITNLLPTMQTYWPSLSGSDDSFWKHEWEKHGTCAMTLPALSTENLFFAETLRLRLKVDFLSILKSDGITPSSSATYTASQIHNSIRASLNVNGVLNCDSNNNLLEIHLCVSKTFQIFACPSTETDNCSGSISIPPIQ